MHNLWTEALALNILLKICGSDLGEIVKLISHGEEEG
jgi:hypothetical protein